MLRMRQDIIRPSLQLALYYLVQLEDAAMMRVLHLFVAGPVRVSPPLHLRCQTPRCTAYHDELCRLCQCAHCAAHFDPLLEVCVWCVSDALRARDEFTID